MSAEFVDYNPRVERHIEKLIGILKTKARQEKDVNFSKLMDNLDFDMYVLYAKCIPLASEPNR